MTKIIVNEDCGNAPRKEFISDFNRAFVENTTDTVLEFMSEDITWNMIGNNVLHGKEEIKKMLKKMEERQATELIIHTIITHGDTAAANGVMKFPNLSIAFCDIYTFTGHNKNAKIKELTTYGIALK